MGGSLGTMTLRKCADECIAKEGCTGFGSNNQGSCFLKGICAGAIGSGGTGYVLGTGESGYTCTCKNGYVGDGKSCTNVNECQR